MAPAENTTMKKVYFHNLDSLRLLAFFAVFISHAALFLGYENQSLWFTNFKTYVLANGDMGVSFFFVLSGFLITYLLLKEQDERGQISLKKFYLRRILRIWPVYFSTLIIGFFVLPPLVHLVIGNQALPFLSDPHLSELPKYFFFLANFSLAFHGGASVPTDILWSISVEEQFYLIWPLVIILVKRKHLPKILFGLIVVSSVYKYIHAYNVDILAYSTFSVMSDLCVGCLLAYALNMKKELTERWKSIPRLAILSTYIFIFVLVVGRHWLYNKLYLHQILFPTVVSLIPPCLASLFAIVIFEQNEADKSIFKLGRFQTLSNLGKISYGLYSYHMIAITLVLMVAAKFSVVVAYGSFLRWILFGAVAFGLVRLIATFSFKTMEQWFLSKKPIN